MARVLCETTSETLFPSMEEAQSTLNWIRDKLQKGVDTAPYPNKIVAVDGGFRYVTYSTLDNEIPVDEFEDLKTSNSLPMVFNNQQLVVIEDASDE